MRRRRNIEPTAVLRWIPERTRCARAFEDDGSSITKAVTGDRFAERESPGTNKKPDRAQNKKSSQTWQHKKVRTFF